MLRAIEAMDLVDEKDRPLAARKQAARRGVNLAPQIFDRAGDGRDLDELRMSRVGDDARQSRFSRSCRTVKQHGGQRVAFDRAPQPRSLPHGIVLPDVVCQRLGPHPHG